MTTYPPQDGVPAWGSPEPEPQQQPALREPGRAVELSCPLCSGSSFTEEEGRLQTRWGMGSHIFTIRICDGCGHALFFHQGGGLPF